MLLRLASIAVNKKIKTNLCTTTNLGPLFTGGCCSKVALSNKKKCEPKMMVAVDNKHLRFGFGFVLFC
jgi:hypothetical protein